MSPKPLKLTKGQLFLIIIACILLWFLKGKNKFPSINTEIYILNWLSSEVNKKAIIHCFTLFQKLYSILQKYFIKGKIQTIPTWYSIPSKWESLELRISSCEWNGLMLSYKIQSFLDVFEKGLWRFLC